MLVMNAKWLSLCNGNASGLLSINVVGDIMVALGFKHLQKTNSQIQDICLERRYVCLSSCKSYKVTSGYHEKRQNHFKQLTRFLTT